MTQNSWNSSDPAQVARGGTGLATLTDNTVLLGSGTDAITPLANGTNNQVLTANTGADPSWETPAAGGDVSAASNLTDDLVIRGDGGAKGVQTSTMSITDAGEMTNTSQPAFLANQGSDADNVTGNGTNYLLGAGIALTSIFDNNSDFDLGDGAGDAATLTAPVTARWYLYFQASFEQLGTADALLMDINTSNRVYRSLQINPSGLDHTDSVEFNLGVNAIADMDAGDTAEFKVNVDGTGADTVDLIFGSNMKTHCSGFQIC